MLMTAGAMIMLKDTQGLEVIPNPLLTTPLHGGDKADGRWQMAEERKDFRQKGGDRGGFGITTNSPQAIAAINCFVDQILSMGNNPDVIFQAIEADPTSVIPTHDRTQILSGQLWPSILLHMPCAIAHSVIPKGIASQSP
jgi:hypothetical protein